MTLMPWQHLTPAEPALNHVRDVPLARLIREDVLASILRGELLPGQRITEPAIAAKLGVSRVPVREALRELESAGMVESRKHTGVFVRQLSATQMADLYELRAVFDAFAGKRAAENPTPQLLLVLKTRMKEMDTAAAAGNVADYYDANLRFHWEIIDATGNAAVIDAYRGIVQKLHLARLANLSQASHIKRSVREHRAIFNAIRKADPLACEALMADHVKAAKLRLFNLPQQGEQHAA